MTICDHYNLSHDRRKDTVVSENLRGSQSKHPKFSLCGFLGNPCALRVISLCITGIGLSEVL